MAKVIASEASGRNIYPIMFIELLFSYRWPQMNFCHGSALNVSCVSLSYQLAAKCAPALPRCTWVLGDGWSWCPTPQRALLPGEKLQLTEDSVNLAEVTGGQITSMKKIVDWFMMHLLSLRFYSQWPLCGRVLSWLLQRIIWGHFMWLNGKCTDSWSC